MGNTNLCYPPLGVGVFAWLQPGETTPSTVGTVQVFQGYNSLALVFPLCLTFNNLLLSVPRYYF